jgi:hypothetical protein
MPHKRAIEAPDFVKDDEIGALLNTNLTALKAYKMQRAAAFENEERLKRLESGTAILHENALRLKENGERIKKNTETIDRLETQLGSIESLLTEINRMLTK